MHYNDRLLAHIKRAEQATQATKAAILRPFGLTPAQQNALAVINEFPGITGAELARRVVVTPQTINSTLNRLIRNGLVERTTHPVHRTLVELRLTELGHDRFSQVDALVSAYDGRLRAALTEQEVTTLEHLTARITAAARSDERDILGEAEASADQVSAEAAARRARPAAT